MIQLCARCGLWYADDADDLEEFDDVRYFLCEYCIMEEFDLFYFEEIEAFVFFFHHDCYFDHVATERLEMMN